MKRIFSILSFFCLLFVCVVDGHSTENKYDYKALQEEEFITSKDFPSQQREVDNNVNYNDFISPLYIVSREQQDINYGIRTPRSVGKSVQLFLLKGCNSLQKVQEKCVCFQTINHSSLRCSARFLVFALRKIII